MDDVSDRCRVMLSAGPGICSPDALSKAAGAGDIASVILTDRNENSGEFAEYCSTVTPALQAKEIAVLIHDDSQTMGRCGADGFYLEKSGEPVEEAIARFSPQKIVGCGGMMNRDIALKTGELNPDFILLGKIGRDIKPEAHRKNLALAQWWAEFVEMPGATLAGNEIASVVSVAQTALDFVMLEKAVFVEGKDPAAMIVEANALLDAHAPRFSEMDE